MQRNTNTGGMGIRKHRISGRPPGNSRAVSVYVNRERDTARRQREARRNPMYGSVRELFAEKQRG